MQNLIKFHLLVHKILSGNEILTITKGNNSVVNFRKLMCINPNLNLVKINAYAKFDPTHQFIHKRLRENKSVRITKDHDS